MASVKRLFCRRIRFPIVHNAPRQLIAAQHAGHSDLDLNHIRQLGNDDAEIVAATRADAMKVFSHYTKKAKRIFCMGLAACRILPPPNRICQ